MMYFAALFFGIATALSNPLASGAFVVFGVLLAATWVNDRIIALGRNQEKIWRKLHK